MPPWAHFREPLAGDAETALDMFDPARYDLVITDFALPNKDGLELADAVKKLAPLLPVILITAYAEAVHGMGGRYAYRCVVG